LADRVGAAKHAAGSSATRRLRILLCAQFQARLHETLGIATNLLHRSQRSEGRRSRALLRLHHHDEADLAERALDRVEAEALGPQIAAALAQLSPVYRDALLLHVWGDLSYEQVAEATHVSVGTVRSRISRAGVRPCHLATRGDPPMTNDYDIEWLTEHRPAPSAPSPTTTDRARASLVVRDTLIDGAHQVDGAVYGGYDLYADSGQYYYAPDSLGQLQQQVDTHQTVIDSNEAKALDTIATAAGGTPAQAREATLSTFPHGLDPMPTPAEVKASDHKMELLTKRRFPHVAPTRASWILSQDSDLWIAATQALEAGAGRSDVRAGAMSAPSTITGVTQTPTEVDGVNALRVDFPDDGQPEIIWLDAKTGVPIQEKDGSNSATSFESNESPLPTCPPRCPPARACANNNCTRRKERVAWQPAARSRRRTSPLRAYETWTAMSQL
jgi:hypothetical protein